MTEFSGAPRLVLGTAIAVTFATGAAAVPVLTSTAPTGFTPVDVTATSGSYSFDLDGNGSKDFTLAGNGTSIVLSYLSSTSGAATFLGNLNGYTSPSSLAIGNVKSGTAGFINGNFGTSAGEYAALATDVTFPTGPGTLATAGTLGYLQGTYTSGATPSFRLLDFGLVSNSAVPEPESWMLMVCGFGVVGAAVRARKAKGAASLAA